jgi:hypothetical protein
VRFSMLLCDSFVRKTSLREFQPSWNVAHRASRPERDPSLRLKNGSARDDATAILLVRIQAVPLPSRCTSFE